MPRINISVGDDIKKWLEGESRKTGIPQSTLVLIGLKTYIDQQRMLDISLKIDEVQNQLNKK